MRTLLLLAVAACADGPSPHDLMTCDPSPAWDTNGDPALHVSRCERACATPPLETGGACAPVICVDHDSRCLGNERCSETFTDDEGRVGCCRYTGSFGSGLTVQFFECVE